MTFNLLSERLLLTLWVGGVWIVGYLAIPMAFALLGDIKLAGDYADELLSVVNMLGLACGSVLLVTKIGLHGKQAIRAWRFWVLALMFALTLIFICYLQPEIVLAKQRNSVTGLDTFTTLHTVSERVYLAISLLGVALVVSTDEINSHHG